MRVTLLCVALIVSTAAKAETPQLTDDDVKRAIVADSTREYPGACPCPSDIAGDGKRCGKRSAYSKPGGEDPICYVEDVTKDDIARYRQLLLKQRQ